MTASALKPSSEDRDRAYRSRLKDVPLPAVLIDCATAAVLAANAGGLNALGLTPADRLPATLDSAMPAVAMLRELQRRGLGITSRHSLIFWRHGRTVARVCDISAADHSAPAHAVVVFRADDEVPDNAPPKPAAELTFPTFEAALAANDDCPPRVIRDDTETLKEIARRIREGQSRISKDTTDQSTTDQTFNPAPDDAAGDDEPELDLDPASQSPWDRPRMAVPEKQKPLQDTDAPRVPDEQAAPPASDEQASASHAAAPEKASEPPAESPEEPPQASSQRTLRSLPPEDISKLAHELKTPLSAIAAAAEIMRDERLGAMGNDKYLGYAADIHESATHALAVISEMLAAAPVSWTRQGPGASFDLTDLAARTVSSLQPLAAQRALTLTLDAEPSLLPVRANATAVRQILLNLLTNALKFTPAGGEVRVAVGYLEDGAIFLVVRDTGDGMNDATLAHAFDDSTETMAVRAGGGRGIGLRLVRRLAAENGADFEIDSAPGRGTVVFVSFPKDLVGAF